MGKDFKFYSRFRTASAENPIQEKFAYASYYQHITGN